jgi:ubiquitin-like 1-activating enzyme E1 B
MAGNIIPAIATTNAIIAGLIVLQALHLIRRAYSALRMVHIQFRPALPLAPIGTCNPNPACGVCRDTYITLPCDPTRTTLGNLVSAVLGEGGNDGGTGPRDVSVYEGARLLADPDWDDNLERTLASFEITRGKFVAIVDEEGEWGTLAVAISQLPCVYQVSI